MNDRPRCILITRDALLRQRVHGFLAEQAVIHDTDDPADLAAAITALSPVLLLVDARGLDDLDGLSALCRSLGSIPLLVFAARRSDPARLAEERDVYAVEPPDVDRETLASHLRHARVLHQLQRENRLLKHRLAALPAAGTVPAPERDASKPMSHFSAAVRFLGESVDAVLKSLAEEIAGLTRASRVGIFTRRENDRSQFHLRFGLRCLPQTETLHISAEAPLARWMQTHAHFVARATLDHIEDIAEQSVLSEVLDMFGADILIPLHPPGGFLGWVFLGRRISGVAYSRDDIDSFMALAEHVGSALETAMLHETLALQKSMLETVFQQVPAGIVTVDPDGCIRTINAEACAILDIPPEASFRTPATRINSHLADNIRRVMTADPPPDPLRWRDPASGKMLFAATRRLMHAGRCLGAVTILQDQSDAERLHEQQERADRAAFWAELAAAIAHEVRNPLVAIKTFVQLLPERYQDETFRNEFSALAGAEIERVRRLVDQILSFADPGPLSMEPLCVQSVLEEAIHDVRLRFSGTPVVITWRRKPQPSRIVGDHAAIRNGFVHLLSNAIEAMQGQEHRALTFENCDFFGKNEQPFTRWTLRDNGPGLPDVETEKLFSPFFTTKTRGIGLGLPITRRIVRDHGGRIEISALKPGTTINLEFPILETDGTPSPPSNP